MWKSSFRRDNFAPLCRRIAVGFCGENAVILKNSGKIYKILGLIFAPPIEKRPIFFGRFLLFSPLLLGLKRSFFANFVS